MEWINATEQKPEVDNKFNWRSIYVFATDGINVGYATYLIKEEKWGFYTPWFVENITNNITHWAYIQIPKN